MIEEFKEDNNLKVVFVKAVSKTVLIFKEKRSLCNIFWDSNIYVRNHKSWLFDNLFFVKPFQNGFEKYTQNQNIN